MENKLDGLTLDLETANKDKLRAVFPECFTESRLDIDKLLSLCGEYITDDLRNTSSGGRAKATVSGWHRSAALLLSGLCQETV